MSIWTHVSGCIRFDGIPAIMECSESDIRKVMGNTVSFDDDEAVWDVCTVPRGSEGSLKYDLVRAGDGLVLWTVPIWGDLRDYEDVDEIESWLAAIVENGKTMIRSAVLEVEVEGKGKVILYEADGAVNCIECLDDSEADKEG